MASPVDSESPKKTHESPSVSLSDARGPARATVVCGLRPWVRYGLTNAHRPDRTRRARANCCDFRFYDCWWWLSLTVIRARPRSLSTRSARGPRTGAGSSGARQCWLSWFLARPPAVQMVLWSLRRWLRGLPPTPDRRLPARRAERIPQGSQRRTLPQGRLPPSPPVEEREHRGGERREDTRGNTGNSRSGGGGRRRGSGSPLGALRQPEHPARGGVPP